MASDIKVFDFRHLRSTNRTFCAMEMFSSKPFQKNKTGGDSISVCMSSNGCGTGQLGLCHILWWLELLLIMDSSAMDISPPRRMNKKRGRTDYGEDDSQPIETLRPAVRRLITRQQAKITHDILLEKARYWA
jgi:hypothetical protein